MRSPGTSRKDSKYAHDRGVIHRDIKPENILLNESGAALIADFGVALGIGSDGTTRLTETGTTVGTPTHMSPEQLFGTAPVDARSDQYSLAATIFEMLAGSPPHDAPTGSLLVAKRLTEGPEPIRQRRADLSVGFERALARGLERDPGSRYPSVSELVGTLVLRRRSGSRGGTRRQIGPRRAPCRTRCRGRRRI